MSGRGYNRPAMMKKRRAEGKTAEFLPCECVNITSMEKQVEALISSLASIIFFQEHKLRRTAVRSMRRQLKEAGWMMHCTPPTTRARSRRLE